MLVIVQFPLFDPRGAQEFSPRDRLPQPVWPAPRSERSFVRGAGRSFERRNLGLQGYFAEDWLCRADRFVKFPHLGQKVSFGDHEGIKLKMAYRHLFADGRFGAKLEIGLEPFSEDVVKAYANPLLLLESVLGAAARLRGRADLHPLISAGEAVAEAYDRATTRHHRQATALFGAYPWQNEQAVRAGPPLLMMVGVGQNWFREMRREGAAAQAGPCAIRSWQMNSRGQRYDLLAMTEDGPSSPYARNLRLFLGRTHMELTSAEFSFNAIDALISQGQAAAARANLESLRAQRLNRIMALHRLIGSQALSLSGARRNDPIAAGADVMGRIWGGRVEGVLERADLLAEKIAAQERAIAGAAPHSLAGGLMRNVFISYRRADTGAAATALVERLRQEGPQLQLFKDTEALRPGGLWGEDIMLAMARCTHVLALIGPDWTGPPAPIGERRIDQPNDIVRHEIEAALALEKPILPILIGEGAFPPPALPSSLFGLSQRHASQCTDPMRLGLVVEQVLSFLRSA
jgi:hypothetical protein